MHRHSQTERGSMSEKSDTAFRSGPFAKCRYHSAMTKTLKILVVDDDLHDRARIAHYLVERGYSVIEAEHGANAVQCFATHNFDLVFMDGQMPLLDGFQAAARMRRMEEVTGEHRQIILVTGLPPEGLAEKCKTSGFDRFFSKPIELQKVDEVLSGLLPIENFA
jgi:CheY-like chemotaxis protein